MVADRPDSKTAIEPCFPNFLDKVLDNANQNDDLILMGDLNLNELEINSKTKLMDNICQIYHLQQLIDLLTRITKESSTLIDLIYASEPSYITTSGVIQLGICDHFGIFASRASDKAKKGRQDHLMIEYRDFKVFDESKFLEDVDSAPWSLIDIYHDINDKVDIFITSQVIECIEQKSHALQLFLRNKTDQAWVFYKQMRNKATESIKASKREYFTKDNPKAMRKTMKAITI